jgi:hypothetical protein
LPDEKPRLQTRRRPSPYDVTISQAMDRLTNIEVEIRKSTQTALRSQAREMDMMRRVVRKGYTANSDTVGWHEQNRSNHDWILKRVAIATDANVPLILFVGSTDARGVREIFPASAFTNFTFANTSQGWVYADSFDNDIYVRHSEDIYIQASGGGTGHLLLVTLEIEEFVPFRTEISEDEAFAISGTPMPVSPEQAPAINMTQDPDEFERHETPGSVSLLADDDLAPDDTEADMDGRPLIPDASAHLPPHLRGL